MMDTIKNVCMYLVIGAILSGISIWLGSAFLFTFLTSNLISLLIALLAINITTLSVLVTKISDLSTSEVNFSNTIDEMRFSVTEQVVLIGAAVVFGILGGSTGFMSWLPYSSFIISTLLATILVYSIDILRDTATSVFIIFKYEQQIRGKKSK